jgi:hypothetical protein
VCSTSTARVDTAAYTEASSPLHLGIQRGIVDDLLGEGRPLSRTGPTPPGTLVIICDVLFVYTCAGIASYTFGEAGTLQKENRPFKLDLGDGTPLYLPMNGHLEVAGGR